MPPVACNDGTDNDGDTKTDYPADPGCQYATDTDETDPPPIPACNDGTDNDGDTKTDYPADPGCLSATDPDEADPSVCDDGVDNDSDTKIDYPADIGCASLSGTTEVDPACGDGTDNDSDNRIDYPEDYGCSSSIDTDETDPPSVPACNDGADNDWDAKTDYPADPGCFSTSDGDESNPPPPSAPTLYQPYCYSHYTSTPAHGSPVSGTIYFDYTPSTGEILNVIRNGQSGSGWAQWGHGGSSGLTPGESYAFSLSGSGGQSTTLSVMACGKATAPRNLAVTAGKNQVTLRWEAPLSKNKDSPLFTPPYVVHRQAFDGTWTEIPQVSSPYVDQIPAGVLYRYKVTWRGAAYGDSIPSDIVPAAAYREPDAPTLTATQGTAVGSIQVSWTPNFDGGTNLASYNLFIADTANGLQAATPLSLPASQTSYTDPTTGTLGPGFERYYQIQAVNAAGPGPRSDIKSATTLQTPKQPTNFNVEPGPKHLKLTWDAVSGVAYKLEGRIQGTTPYTYTQDPASSGLFHGGTPGTLGYDETWEYRLTPYNAAGNGPPVEGKAKTFGKPAAPLSLHGESGPQKGEITVTWDPPADNGGYAVTSYKLYSGASCPSPELGTFTNPRKHVHTGLGNGELKWYCASAINEAGEGPKSLPVSANAPDVPGPPRHLKRNVTATQLNLTWFAPEWDGGLNVTNYIVYKTTNGATYTQVGNVTQRYFLDAPPLCAPGTPCLILYRVAAVNPVGQGPNATEPRRTWPPESIRGTTPGSGLTLRQAYPCPQEPNPSVNLVSGQLLASTCILHTASDYEGLDVTYTLTHRAGSGTTSPVGENWFLSVYRRIDVDNGTATLSDGTGRLDEFKRSGTTWSSPPGYYAQLTSTPTGFVLEHAGGMKETFNATGARTRIEDLFGNHVAFEHDSSGHLIEVVDAQGRRTNLNYEGEHLTRIADHAGRIVTFTYDGNRLASITTPSTATGTLPTQGFTYTPDGDLKSAPGIAKIDYDDKGRVRGQVDPVASVIASAINSALSPVGLQLCGAGAYNFTYQPDAKATIVKDSNGYGTRWQYVSNQTPLPTSKNPETSTAYCNAGTRTMTAATYVGDPANLEITSITANGNTTLFQYNSGNANPKARGNLLESRIGNKTTTYTYEATYQNVRTITADGKTTTFVYGQDEAAMNQDYDGDGDNVGPPSRVVFVAYPTINPDGAPTPLPPQYGTVRDFEVRRYNGRGQLTWHLDGELFLTEYTYYEASTATQKNPVGSLRQEISHEERITFTPVTILPMSSVSAYEATDIFMPPSGPSRTTTYTYDGRGNVETIKDPTGKITEYGHDNYGRVTSIKSKGKIPSEVSFAYDVHGNLIEKKTLNVRAQNDGTYAIDSAHPYLVDTFVYDALGRKTDEYLDAAGSTVTTVHNEFGYDFKGNLVLKRRHDSSEGIDANDAETYLYDHDDRLVAKTVGGKSPLFALSAANGGVNATDIRDPFTLYLHANNVADAPLGPSSYNTSKSLPNVSTTTSMAPAPLPETMACAGVTSSAAGTTVAEQVAIEGVVTTTTSHTVPVIAPLAPSVSACASITDEAATSVSYAPSTLAGGISGCTYSPVIPPPLPLDLNICPFDELMTGGSTISPSPVEGLCATATSNDNVDAMLRVGTEYVGAGTSGIDASPLGHIYPPVDIAMDRVPPARVVACYGVGSGTYVALDSQLGQFWTYVSHGGGDHGYNMNPTPPHQAASRKAAPGVSVGLPPPNATRMVWEWNATDGYDFQSMRFQVVFYAARLDSQAQGTNAWKARLYSNNVLVASNDVSTGTLFQQTKDFEVDEYRISLGTATAVGHKLRLELEPVPTPNSRIVFFDSRETPSRLEIGDSITETIEYDAAGRIASTTRGNGQKTYHHYDANGNEAKISDDSGTHTEYVHDAQGRILREDVYGRHATANPSTLLARTWNVYNEAGLLQRRDVALFDPATGTALPDAGIISGDGRSSTFYGYDALGRMTIQIHDDGSNHTWTYNGYDEVVAEKDETGNTYTYEYSAAGHLIHARRSEKKPDNSVVARDWWYSYDDAGNRIRTVDPLGHAIHYGYDAGGRVAWMQDAKGDVVNDPATQFTGLVNINGNRATYTYDAQGRLIKADRELRSGGTGSGSIVDNVITEQEWDAAGRLVAQIDDRGGRTEYAYNNAGQLLNVTHPDGTKRHLQWDANHNLLSIVEPNGATIQFIHDSQDNLAKATGQSPYGTTTHTYAHDGLGRLIEAIRQEGSNTWTVTRSLDSLGLPRQETQDGQALARTFDGLGQERSLTYPDGRVVSRHYTNGRLTSLTDSSGTLHAYTYGTQNLASETAGAVTTAYTLDAVDRVTRINVNVAGTKDLQFEYAYNRNGARTSQALAHAPTFSAQFSHDSLDRLTVAARGNFQGLNLPATPPSLTWGAIPSQTTWSLDGAHNWQHVTRDGVQRSNTFGATNRLDSTSQNGVTTSYTYDANGNLLSDGTYEYTYDAFNQLRKVRNTAQNKDLASFSYDALGRRVLKMNDVGATAKFIHDGVNVIEERSSNNALQRQYVFGDGADEVLVMDVASGAMRYHYVRDDLGSIVALADNAGNVKEGYLYDAYGKTAILAPGPNGVFEWGNDDVNPQHSLIGNPYGFTGQRLDKETGLYFYKARYYKPDIGRFLNVDPIGAWGDEWNLGNPYAYVASQPNDATDPSGFIVTVDRRDRPQCMTGDWLERKLCRMGRQIGVESDYLPMPSPVRNPVPGGLPAPRPLPSPVPRTAPIVPRAAAAADAAVDTLSAGSVAINSAKAGPKVFPEATAGGRSISSGAERASMLSRYAAAAGAAGRSGTAVEVSALNPGQAQNYARFVDKLPKGHEAVQIFDLPGGGMAFQANVPGRVPGSFAIYEKQVDAVGRTLQYTKTTVDPAGHIIHVKDKIGGGVV